MRQILGRHDNWALQQQRVNPVRRVEVNQYTAFTTQEQFKAGVSIQQAVPLLRHELQTLVHRMNTWLMFARTPHERLVLSRDIALFTVHFTHGLRGSVFYNMLGSQIPNLPEDAGLAINLQFTKTLKAGAVHLLFGGTGT